MNTKLDLYRWRISDLIDQHRPFLVVFGTPQHCTMCVDQLTRVAVMQEKYGNRFAFVHVDGYKDNAVWVQWGVKGEPWTFIVDAKGRVRKVFPGQTELALLEQEIQSLLTETG
jgi:thioredoxin-like negative regulator of GroEL